MPSPLSDFASLADPMPDTLRAEAARYALLRRLAAALRHDLVVPLQPLRLMLELLDRRLGTPSPDLEAAREAAQRLQVLARSALDASADVVSWIAPDARTVPAQQGVAECVSLLASALGFRGVSVEDACDDATTLVSRASLRCLVCASLLHLADAHAGGLHLRIRAESPREGGVRLHIDARPTSSTVPEVPPLPYRGLTEADVRALAHAEGAEWRSLGADGVWFSLPAAAQAQRAASGGA